MKVNELLYEQYLGESIDFAVAKYIHDDPKFPNGLYSSVEFEKEVMKDCPACDGTGIEKGEPYGVEDMKCMYCTDGKYKAYETDYDQLNTNNTNGMIILRDLFGISQPDEAGHIEASELPALLKKLKAMRRDHGMEFMKQIQGEPVSPGAARAKHGIPYRWDNDSVNHYLNTLIGMIEFAIKNDATIVWS